MIESKVRIVSSLIICVAYIVTFYHDVTAGARLYLVGNLLALPYMIKNKLWDMVALLSFFIVFGIPKVIGN